MHRFLNCVWTWCLQRVPPDKMEQWIWEMNQPLPGDEKAEPTDREIEQEGAAFMDFMAQAQAGKV